ncbi:MAG: hypothetical protein QXU67_05895 [Candidatus Bathyarchaeia archaeon]
MIENKTPAFQATLVDPSTSAILTTNHIGNVKDIDEMFKDKPPFVSLKINI